MYNYIQKFQSGGGLNLKKLTEASDLAGDKEELDLKAAADYAKYMSSKGHNMTVDQNSRVFGYRDKDGKVDYDSVMVIKERAKQKPSTLYPQDGRAYFRHPNGEIADPKYYSRPMGPKDNNLSNNNRNYLNLRFKETQDMIKTMTPEQVQNMKDMHISDPRIYRQRYGNQLNTQQKRNGGLIYKK